MLVLSRGQNDKVVFPTLGITVEILRLVGNRVKLGIDAPKHVPILRDELAGGAAAHEAAAADLAAAAQLTHSLRNRLQKATLGLRLLERLLANGQAEDAEPMIFRIFNELKSIEEELGPPADAMQPRQQGCRPDGERQLLERSRRALIVEDDESESEMLAGYLRLSGFEVSTALDGLQAMVQLARHDRPDVVLMDMKMPRFDGSKTVAAIRQNADYRALKIFAVTGSEQGEMAVSIGPQGVDRWFRKPVDPEYLVSAIHDELGTPLTSA